LDISKLIREAYPGLKKYALSLTNYNNEDAEDLVQKAVLKAYEKIDSFTRNDNFGGWVATLMRNLFIDEKRSIGGKTFSDIEDEVIPVSDNTDRFFEVRDIMKGILALSKKCQNILSLVADGYKYDEIASKLTIPIGTVMSSLLRCRQNLNKELYG